MTIRHESLSRQLTMTATDARYALMVSFDIVGQEIPNLRAPANGCLGVVKAEIEVEGEEYWVCVGWTAASSYHHPPIARPQVARMANYPERIVCLTEETTETLYLLGEDWRIIGISGFTVRPQCARREKPVVSAFTKARIPDIVKLNPDLVLGFSDIQAKIAAQLVEAGIEVHIFNQRTIAGILRMIRVLGGMLGCSEKSEHLSAKLESRLDALRDSSTSASVRPRVYFEEWNDPIITGIGWVSELIEIAGGIDCFADRACRPLAKDRIIADPYEPVKRDPEIIIGSWCDKPFKTGQVTSRPGWEAIAAVRNNRVYEIDSSIILQPGPAALTDGVDRLREIISFED